MPTKSKRRLPRIRKARRGRRRRPARPPKTKFHVPRTMDQFFAMPERLQDRWNRVTQAVTLMRKEGVSLQQASREFGLKPDTVLRFGGSALRKRQTGRFTAKPSDRLLRVLVLPTEKGLREVALRDSREASLIGGYWAAVQKYLATGDASGLKRIRRKTIRDVNGKRIRLITDLEELDKQASAGILGFESIYGGVA